MGSGAWDAACGAVAASGWLPGAVVVVVVAVVVEVELGDDVTELVVVVVFVEVVDVDGLAEVDVTVVVVALTGGPPGNPPCPRPRPPPPGSPPSCPPGRPCPWRPRRRWPWPVPAELVEVVVMLAVCGWSAARSARTVLAAVSTGASAVWTAC